jgi:flagellar hook-length control protein FliK
MKMIVNNKLQGNGELAGIKSYEKSSNIDALFAELFALVNLNSIDSEKTSFEKFGAKEIDEHVNITDSNKNTVNVARSLAEVFYKELGIDDKSVNEKTNNNNNIEIFSPKDINFKDIKGSDSSTNLKNLTSLNENKKEINFKNMQETNKNLSDQKGAKIQNLEIKIKKVEKVNFDNNIQKIGSLNKTNNKLETDQLRNINSHVNANRVKSSKETSIMLKEKKISKKKNDSIIAKTDNEKEVVQKKINKESPSKVIGTLTRNTGKNSNETSVELKNSNNHKTKSLEKHLQNNQNFNTKETLNLLESSWGEKFTKIIKNSIDRGISKLNFDLKPKNLGKISLEVTVKDSKTSIQISAESQEAANILNDNLPRLSDLIEEKNSKFSLFNEGNNHSNYFNQQKQKQDDRQETTVFKKKVNELKKIKTNNSIDVNA